MEASCTLSFSTGEDIPLFPGHFYDIVPPSASARKAHQDYVRVRNSDEPAPTKVLAQLEVQGPIVAISAQNSDVFISPSPFPVKSQSHFRLRSAGQPEQRIKYLILREGETIRFTNQKFSFKLIYNITESRVNSSAPAEKVQVNSSVPNEGYDNTLEDSSARQVTVEKLPDTRLQQRSTVKDSVATPRASARSQLVEETPTASRIQQTVPMGSMSEKSVYISAYDGTADEPSPSHRRPSLFGGDSGADDRVSTDHEDLDIEFGKVVMPLQEASTAGRGQHATKEDEDEGSEEDEDEDTLTVGGSKSLKGLPKAAEEEAESEGEDEGGAEEKIGEEDEPDDGGKVEEDKETAAAKEDAMNTAIDDSADHDGGRSTSLKPSPPETAPKKRRRTEAERLQEADLPTKRPKTSKIVSETEDVRDNFGSLDDDEIVVAPRKPGRPPKKGRAPVYKGKRGPKKLVAAEIEDENLEESSEEAAEKAPQRRVKKAVAAEIEDEDPEESSEEAAEKAPQRKVKKVVKSEIRVDVPPRASTSPDKTPIASFSESQTSKGTPSSAKAAYDGDTLEVVLTNSKLTNMKQMMKFLEDHCNRKEAVSEDTDVVCVGKGRIITTSKLLLGIVLGKRIVSDSWITESAKAKQVLDPDQYLVRDEDHNDQWGRCLGDVFDDPLPELFSGKILYFSPALKAVYKSGFKDIEKIAEAAGATKVISKAWTNPKDGEEIIPMGLEEGDAQVTKMREKDVVCYSKDLLSHSILRGKLSLDDDDLKIGTKKGKDRLRRPSE